MVYLGLLQLSLAHCNPSIRRLLPLLEPVCRVDVLRDYDDVLRMLQPGVVHHWYHLEMEH